MPCFVWPTVHNWKIFNLLSHCIWQGKAANPHICAAGSNKRPVFLLEKWQKSKQLAIIFHGDVVLQSTCVPLRQCKSKSRRWNPALWPHSLASSYTIRTDEGLGEQWLEVWHQLTFYVNPWGVSQNLILWEPLPWQGIPAGNWCPHPCHGHSRGPPPLGLQRQQGNTHASLLPTPSSQWVTGLWTDGQFVFGWFRITYLLVVSGLWANSQRSRTAAIWLHGGMCYCLSLQGEGMFWCSLPRKGHKWAVMSSIEYLRVSTSPSSLLFVSTWNTLISQACKFGPRSLHQSVCLCT